MNYKVITMKIYTKIILDKNNKVLKEELFEYSGTIELAGINYDYKRTKGNKICPAGIAWAKRTFDKYPSAYANMAASKYCKDPNYAKKSKK